MTTKDWYSKWGASLITIATKFRSVADLEQLRWIVVQLVRAPLVPAEVASSCLVNLTGALIHKLTVNLKSQLTKAPKPNAHWMFSSYFRIVFFASILDEHSINLLCFPSFSFFFATHSLWDVNNWLLQGGCP